jgi:hypothetical protein
MRFHSRPAFLRWSNAAVFALGAATLVASSAFAITGRLFMSAQATGSCSGYPEVYAFAEVRNVIGTPDCDIGLAVGSGSSVQANSICKFPSTPENVYAMIGTWGNGTRTIGAQSAAVAWGGGATYVSGNPSLGSPCSVSVFAWGQ